MSLSTPPLVELGVWAQEAGFGTQGTDLFVGRRPPAPARLTVIAQYPGGERPEYTQTESGVALEHFTFQVLCRDVDELSATVQAQKIWEAIARVDNQVLQDDSGGGSFYLWVHPHASPGLIGYDENQLFMVAFSATACRRS